MAKVKKDLLVSLADANFIPQVKQLFASVYYKSGWTGDYMLLSDKLSEEDKCWFKEKGILLFCPPLLSTETFGHRFYPPLLFSKFFLFHEYFKKWRSVIFLDSDIIVRASFSDLAELSGFNAPRAITIRLKDEFVSGAGKELSDKYNLRRRAFTTGTFAFNTDIIKPETLSEMLTMFEKYRHLCFFGEEAVMNLFFYDSWNEISELYNYVPWYMQDYFGIKNPDFPAPIIHWVCGKKPWEENHPSLLEWRNNLSLADSINLDERLPAIKVWSEEDKKHYLIKMRIRDFIYIFRYLLRRIDRQIGRFGLLIKRYNPGLYEKIKIKKK